MWINPMLSIWLYAAIGFFIINLIILYMFYGDEK